MQEETKQEPEQHPEPPHVRKLRQIIGIVVRQQENTVADPRELMFELVEAVMQASQDEIAGAFVQEVQAAEQMARVERRIKFMLHPDRNGHTHAKDAFQRLSSNSWRLKYTKLLL